MAKKKKITRKAKAVKNLFKGKKIVFASGKRVSDLDKFVGQVLQAINDICGAGVGAWVSDESCISDFPISKTNIKKLQDILMVPVEVNDYIVDVAQRLKDVC
jgi:hydroxymethylpyrimidine pyrophosphatase-like HAD family hydrolase